MTVEVRRARPEDMEALLDLYRDLHPQDLRVPPSEESRARFRETLAAVNIFVAEENGRLVSTAMLAVIPNLTRGMKPFGVVENMVTASGQRRKGLGRRIMSRVIDEARSRGCYKVMLLSKHTPEAESLYRGLGFQEERKTGLTLRFGVEESSPKGHTNTKETP